MVFFLIMRMLILVVMELLQPQRTLLLNITGSLIVAQSMHLPAAALSMNILILMESLLSRKTFLLVILRMVPMVLPPSVRLFILVVMELLQPQRTLLLNITGSLIALTAVLAILRMVPMVLPPRMRPFLPVGILRVVPMVLLPIPSADLITITRSITRSLARILSIITITMVVILMVVLLMVLLHRPSTSIITTTLTEPLLLVDTPLFQEVVPMVVFFLIMRPSLRNMNTVRLNQPLMVRLRLTAAKVAPVTLKVRWNALELASTLAIMIIAKPTLMMVLTLPPLLNTFTATVLLVLFAKLMVLPSFATGLRIKICSKDLARSLWKAHVLI